MGVLAALKPAANLLLRFSTAASSVAVQSLGATNPSYLPAVYAGGMVLGIALAIGFLILPVCIFFFFETPDLLGGV